MMIFTETKLKGAFIIDLQPHEDDRGFFARTKCVREYTVHGLKFDVVQSNMGRSRHKGTVRGMHFQFPPAAETKVVRCMRGAFIDIIVDLRPESPTFLAHIAVELTADNGRALYVPERFAHGYQTLVDDTDTYYDVGAFHDPANEFGLHHADPRLGLAWPLPVSMISQRDSRHAVLDLSLPEVIRRMSLTPEVA